MDITGMRKEYRDKHTVFLEDSIDVKDPIDLFHKWFVQVQQCKEIQEPNAMCLATATKDGKPSARFVLLKGYGNEGFKFFTHYTSRKGQELEENPNAALTFYWEVFSRSVRIEGSVRKLPFSDADDYFSKRPYASQLGALCSDQSKPVEGRHVLMSTFEHLKEKYKEGEVPRPQFWGGYLVVPDSIEFWQGQTDRIHDRIKFRKPNPEETADGIHTHVGENGWIFERLAP